MIAPLKCDFGRMKMIYADGEYRGELIDKVTVKLGYDVEITLRSDKAADFKPWPKRWIVAKTFAWFESFRRRPKITNIQLNQGKPSLHWHLSR